MLVEEEQSYSLMLLQRLQ